MAQETQQACIRFPVKLLEKVDQQAEIEHRDRSNMIVHIVSLHFEMLEAQKKDKPDKSGWVKVEEGWVN